MAIRWGIFGTDWKAKKIGLAIHKSSKAELVAVADQSPLSNVAEFSRELRCDRHFDSYMAMLYESDLELDAIYVGGPKPFKSIAILTTLAIREGMSILCESPMGTNFAECMAIATLDSKRQSSKFLMEAILYPFQPQMKKVLELVKNQEIGSVQHIHASFGSSTVGFNSSPQELLADVLIGGGIMNFGHIPLSLVLLIASQEPVEVKGYGHLNKRGMDTFATCSLAFEDGMTAHIVTRDQPTGNLDNTVQIIGTKGSIHVPWPWYSHPQWKFQLMREGESETLTVDFEDPFDRLIEHVHEGIHSDTRHSGVVGLEHSVTLARTMDKWRDQVGVTFDSEKLEDGSGPPLIAPFASPGQFSPECLIKHNEISDFWVDGEGEDNTIARLVFDCTRQTNEPLTGLLFDYFFRLGGNVFSTKLDYSNGGIKQDLAHWIERRKIREQVFVIARGPDTPEDFPQFVKAQVNNCLEQLKLDYVDLFLLNQDNEDVPVGEWVDALNEQYDLGYCFSIGASNWSLERIKCAIKWAENHNKERFSAIENRFSFAELDLPVFDGCQNAQTPDFLDFLTEYQLPLIPWAWEAGDFFGETFLKKFAGQDSTENPFDVVLKGNSITAEDLHRWQTAKNLAAEYRCSVLDIALHYVLNQPFPTIAVVDPRSIHDLDKLAMVSQGYYKSTRLEPYNGHRPDL